MTDLAGKVAIVTGGAQGIGEGISLTLARGGAAVVVADLNEARAREVAGHIETRGGKALAVGADVSSKASVRAMVDGTVARFGTVHILVNNAGVFHSADFEEISEEEWDRVMAVDLKGSFLCTQAVVPYMKRQRWGRVIFISSLAGRVGALIAGAHYSVAKAGQINLGKLVAKLYALDGITANTVAPAAIATQSFLTGYTQEQLESVRNSIPQKRFGTVEDVAEMVAYLASEKAGYITGQTIDVNGGVYMS